MNTDCFEPSLRRAGLALALIAAAGCSSLAPRYERPDLGAPAAFSGPAPGAPEPAESPADWWTLFGDSRLDELVSEARRGNQDLALAAARVEEARALAGLAAGDRWPQTVLRASGSRTRLSEATSQLPPSMPLETQRVRATAELSFELDFWGRLRHGTRAARAELLASEEGRRQVELAVAADVTAAWFDLRSLDRRLAIASHTLASRREAVRLQRLRFAAGTISELDLAQAEAELAATEATVPALRRAVRQVENRLGVLLGRVGGSIARTSDDAFETLAAPLAPAGLPSSLLLRRPDVLAAEQRLIASQARIGVARAAYFPTISLTGSAGSESQQLSGLFAGGTGVWSAAFGLVRPLIDIGRTRREVGAARARERQALAGYAKTVQTAFAEVEDALAARATGGEERAALERQAEALDRARNLAALRYEAGDASYLEVLDAERNLFRAQLQAVEARRAELGAAVLLFKALGGGWTVAAPSAH